jgi:hypothetical protein
MALQTMFVSPISMWDGKLHTGHPAGWAEGTKLADMLASPPKFYTPIQLAAEAIRRSAHESQWAIEQASGL